MTGHLSKPIKSKTWEDLRTIAEALPKPANWFHGHACQIPVLPRDILTFFRAHQLELAPTATHSRFVLAICIEGAGGVIIDGVIHHLRTGSCILIFPYQTHSYTRFASQRPAWLFLTFEMEHVPEMEPLRGNVLPLDDRMLDCLHCTLRSLTHDPEDSSEAPIHLLFGLNYLLNEVQNSIAGISLNRPDRLIAERLKKIIGFIQEHSDEPLSVEAVAGACNLSPSRLRSFFKSHVGFSLGRYIRQTRIHTVCEAMRHEGLNVTEAADRFGFSSTYAFSRTFKEVMGVPPSKYCFPHEEKSDEDRNRSAQ